jgi:2-amino-4-hydroxy-6-hydroxymethyldihydropteridine diphosphokinase
MSIYYLSLGSNLGDRLAHLRQALVFLRELGDVLKVSSAYETGPVGMAEGAGDFYNMAVALRSSLAPEQLLQAIKGYERLRGRDLSHSHYQPRAIDIDILMAERPDRPEGLIIETEQLTIPHKQMVNRAFVLAPLEEIAPSAVHPVLKKTVKELEKDYIFDKKIPIC